MIKINIDRGAQEIISRLESFGYKGYAVGGCVRDSLLGKNPYDWDITTNAHPEKTCEIFKDYPIIPTGLKHGTVTVRVGKKNYEVTTFRCDGEYFDSRHPESVGFVNDISEDLKRRDFTINAIAYNENDGLIDLYGGLFDLNNKIIRAVGNSYDRFTEDALRILRGVRFSAQLGFSVEEETLKAMNLLSKNLNKVSVERVFVELEKLLTGEYVKDALYTCYEVIFSIIPELRKSYKFNQHSKWHSFDVYGHTVEAVGHIENEKILRFTMLFHDIGKPDKFFMSEDGQGHFYGHPERSKEITAEILKRLKAPTSFSKEVLLLVENHDKYIPIDRFKIKKALNKFGEKNFFRLIKIKLADNHAQATQLALNECDTVNKLKELAEDIVKSEECFSLKTLKVDGKDASEVGFKGKEIGEVLDTILSDVMAGNIPNDRQALMKSLMKRKERKDKI